MRRDHLGRRLLAEFIGTGLLVTAVIGSGIAAARLSPGDVGLELLENTAATVGALIALILALGPVSGAHLNPVVTLADRFFGGISTKDAAGYMAAQITGALGGALLANAMFALPLFEASTKSRSSGPLWLAEVVATFGLVVVIFGVVRSGRAAAAPFAVGAYIGGAYFFTSSTSFANPAVTIGRTISNTFAGIRPTSAPPFVAMQLIGAALAVAAVRVLYPHMADPASNVVVPPPSRHLRQLRCPAPPARGAVMTTGHLGRTQGGIVEDLPIVLFLCIHNSGRSVAARALLDHYAQGRVEVLSAGSEPGDQINPAVAQILTERGLDATKEVPKPITYEIARTANVIVTMGCGDACPVFPGNRHLDWELTDPAGLPVEQVRPIVDEIDRRVQALLAELVPDPNWRTK